MDYYHRSIEIILQNQSSSGAYIASPVFSNYQYCWLRDGSFIAHSMDRVGEYRSAETFFRWVDRVITKYADKVNLLEEQLKSGHFSPDRNFLFTRYTLAGEEENSESTWGNFQIDGYGTWLWALAEHVRLTGNHALLSEFSGSITTTVRYLNAAWQLPNYDCWEEHPEYLHPYSLSAVYGGLKSVSDLVGAGKLSSHFLRVTTQPSEVKDFLCRYAVVNDKFVKHVSPSARDQKAHPVEKSGVDSSLLGLAVPYRVFALNDPLILATVAAIEAELHRPEGGVYRYKKDVYFGGGEWLILSAWLGWYYALRGEIQRARDLKSWIEKNVDSLGNMPEQVSEYALVPAEIHTWVKSWGPIANPLLWSHAMYLILAEELK